MNCRFGPVSTAFGLLGLCMLPAAAQTGAISGTVTDSTTGSPLSDVRVEVLLAGQQRAAISDSRGEFRLTNLAPGRYTLRFTRLGYESLEVEATVSDEPQLIEIALVSIGVPLDPVIIAASRSEQTALDAPASVSVVSRGDIEDGPALGPIEAVRSVTGVDLATKGLIQHTFAVRGSRASNSGTLLTLADHRQAALPSIGFNVPYLIPASTEDVDRIEVVRGPAAALYGPNGERGVLHILTRSPFDSPGASVSLSGGERSLLQGTVRYAGIVHPRIALRVSGSYTRGNDWEFTDSAEVRARGEALQAGADPDTLRIGVRDFDLERGAAEARVDWRPGADTDIIASGGVAQGFSFVDLAGAVASVQGKDWRYRYGQLRFRHKAWFTNAFYNENDAGETYVLRTGNTLVDNSRQFAVQARHESMVAGAELLYGADVRWTDPRTGGTINGENEDDDLVAEWGGYLHVRRALSPTFKLSAAVRLDYHNRLDDLAFSPRAALVFQPAATHAIRLSYNRAFTSPDPTDLFVDIGVGALPGGLPYDIRAVGRDREGYTFRLDCGGPCMRSPFNPGGPQEYIPADATVLWGAFVQILAQQGVDLSGIPRPTAQQVGTVFGNLDPVAETFAPTAVGDIGAPVPGRRREITNTVEVGYRGLIGGRISAAVDLYVNRRSNVATGRRVSITPMAFLDSVSLDRYLQDYFPAAQAAQVSGLLAQIPAGTISPQETEHFTDVLLTTALGSGSYTYWGADLSLAIDLPAGFTATGSYSFVSEDSIPNVARIGDVIFGVPRNKGSLGFGYRHDATGFSAMARARAVQSFPVNSGLYQGRVDSYAVLDASIGYRFGDAPRVVFSLQAQNLLDNRHQEFVGAPALGRLVYSRLRLEF